MLILVKLPEQLQPGTFKLNVFLLNTQGKRSNPII
jgi:hypothetical protein